MILKVRLGAMKKYKKTKYPNAKFVNERYSLAEKYFKFLGQRTKIKGDESAGKNLHLIIKLFSFFKF